MSKFLTPPVWYDKNGNLNEMLTGNAGTSSDIAIGSGATAVDGGIAIGGSAGRGGVAIGGGASANEENSIAIGLNATVSELGCIAIGSAANVSTSDTIQLGNNDLRYTLNIGDGTGTIHTGTITLNGVRLSASGGVIQLGNNNTAYTLNVGKNTIDPALIQDFFAGNMDVGGVSGNLYVYSNLYKSGEAGSPRTGWYRAEIDSVEQTVVVRDGNGKIKAADPTAANEVATKQYVDKEIANAIAALKL